MVGVLDEVAGMSLDNFIVRPKRRVVEKFQAREAWNQLGRDDRAALVQQIAGLPSAYEDDDIAAKQFDYLVLQAQLAVLRVDTALVNYQARIMGIVSQLEELRNIPMVAAQMTLIMEVQTDEFWQDINLPILENMRRHMRQLVKLIEPKDRKIVYTDFQDEIGAAVDVVFPTIGAGTNKARFLMKVRHFLTQHENHITIQKLRRSQQLTPQDLSELERMFLAESVASPDDLARIRNEGGLGLFVRSLVGLDREAAKQAIAGFIAGRSANQIEFLDLIVDYLTERGVMDPRRLYESPFTDLDDQGASGVFSPADVKILVEALAQLKANTAA
jgi:type I restriction enzyme, R subunit